MPIVGLNTYEDNEILTAGKLNTQVQALESKFNAITGDDLVWPLIAGGNIDFDQQHSILGLQKFWSYTNASEYDSLQLAIDAAEAAGGGCVLIPPDTTITADSVDIEASQIWVVGCGPSSVIQMTGGASGGYLIRTGSGTLADIGICNLTLNGQSVASQDGFQFRFVDGCTVDRVTFKNFGTGGTPGNALTFTHAGTAGTQTCQDVSVTNCRFKAGSGAHIKGIDIDKGTFENILSTEGTATAVFDFEPSTSAGLLKNLSFNNVKILSATGIGLQILGASGTANDNWSLISLKQVHIPGSTGDAFIIGFTAKILKYVMMSDCSAPDSGADAMKLCTSESQVKDNFLYSATGDGIDMLDTESTVISGNNILSAGATSIVPASAAALGNRITGNHGYISITDGAIYADAASYTHSAGVDGTIFTRTIPANTVHAGSMFRMRFDFDMAGGGAPDTGTITFNIDSNPVGTFAYNATRTGVVMLIETVVTDMTGANTDSRSLAIDEQGVAADNISHGFVNDTVDWTTDIDIHVYVAITGAGTNQFTLKHISIEVLGAD